MSDTQQKEDQPAAALKDEFARQRWELFHRAIAHAKQSNMAAWQESEAAAASGTSSAPLLTIAR